jgi:hypothetical protein
MALKGKPIAITNSATTIYTCPAGTEASVHGLIFSNNTGGTLSVNVLVFNQADNTTVTVATGLLVPANQFITWTKPINLAAGDRIQAVASASTGIVCLFSVFEGSAAPVAIGFTGRGVWSNVATYAVNDIASVTGSGTYLALQASTNQDPTSNTAAWMFLEGISASALPPQSGQSGNFLTTDGTDASWAVVDVAGGTDVVNPMTTNITLTSANKRVQVLTADAPGRRVILPTAGTLTLGELFLIVNKSPFTIFVDNSAGQILLVVPSNRAGKFLLVDTGTSDWEAYNVEISGNIQSTVSVQTPNFRHTAGPFNPTIRRLANNRYTTAYSSLEGPWRQRFETFELSDDGNFVTLAAGDYNRYSPNGSTGNTGRQYLNSFAFLDDNVIVAGAHGDWGQNPARVNAFEFNLNSSLELRHVHEGVPQNAAFPAVTRIGTRRGVVAYSRAGNDQSVTNIELQVLDYSSSLTSPTIGAKSNVAPGGTHRNGQVDIDRLEDNRGVLMYNSRTGNTGTTQYEKRVLAWSVSGTTITTGSPITLSNTNVEFERTTIRALDSTTAIAAWISGTKVIGRVVKISGTTVTAGPQFDLAETPLNVGSVTINTGENANTFYTIAQNGSDNNCAYMAKYTISGTSVTSSPYSKISTTLGLGATVSSTSFYDSVRDRLVVVHPGQGSLAYTLAISTQL